MKDHTQRVTVKPSICPNRKCGALTDTLYAESDKDVPNPGDVSVCHKCGLLMVFNKKLILVAMSKKQIEKLAINDPQVLLDAVKISIMITEGGRQ